MILGQPDPHTEGPAAGGRGPANGMHLPTGGRARRGPAHRGRRLAPSVTGLGSDADADRNPTRLRDRPTGFDVRRAEQRHDPTASTFYWPFGIALIDGHFYVADTGNRRVLIWHGGVPEPGQAADVVLGQPDAGAREENRGGDEWPPILFAGRMRSPRPAPVAC